MILYVVSPNRRLFPGCLWVTSVPAAGTMQTGYVVNSKTNSFVGLIEQSAGAPANFDNAMKYGNLGILYKCP
jgi:hypothetical protein